MRQARMADGRSDHAAPPGSVLIVMQEGLERFAQV
jgi:hypothetical protein